MRIVVKDECEMQKVFSSLCELLFDFHHDYTIKIERKKRCENEV